MKLNKIFLIAILAVFVLACKKDSPIGNIGSPTANDENKASLRVTLSNRTPSVGDSIIVTATTWHVLDQINKVDFVRTVVEKYGVNLELNNTSLDSWLDEKTPAFLVVDSVYKEELWQSVSGNVLTRYFETASDAYVIRQAYKDFKPKDLKDAALINALSDEAFRSLKDHLSRNINVQDYKALFPSAPTTDITGSVLSSNGKANLNANLTRQLLINTVLKSAYKKGELILSLKVRVTAQKTAGNEVINVFQTKY